MNNKSCLGFEISHATMTKIINKSVIMLYDITLLMFIGIIRNIVVLYYYTTAFKKCN